MPKTSPLKLENRCLDTEKHPTQSRCSSSILAKKMENTRTAQDGKEKPLTTAKFRTSDRMGTLRLSAKDRSKYLDDLDGANVMMVAKEPLGVSHARLHFTRMFYVILKL